MARPRATVCKVCGDARDERIDEALCSGCYSAICSDRKRRSKYGVEPAQYMAMRARQEDRCAICDCDFDADAVGGPKVDHDHTTGIVRELLCNGCNLALGLCDDDPGRLEACAAYLRRHGRSGNSETTGRETGGKIQGTQRDTTDREGKART